MEAAPCAVRLHAVRSNHSSVCKFLTAVVNTVSKQPIKSTVQKVNRVSYRRGGGGGGGGGEG